MAYERIRRWRSQLGSGHRSSRRTALLPVHVIESEPTVAAPGFDLELSRGLRLHVPAAFDEASLARLLRVVEAGA